MNEYNDGYAVRVMRFHRLSVALLLSAALASLSMPAAGAASMCSFDPGTATVSVSLDAGGDSVFLAAGGGAITADGISCGGASVTSTDLIQVLDSSSGGSTTITIDMAGGLFAPGLSDEPGASDEIEFDMQQGDGTSDAVVIIGSASTDGITVGSEGANLNGAESDAIDIDVVGSGTDAWTLQGSGGKDALSAGGDATTGLPLTAGTTLNGGSGPDSLIGGGGPDLFIGGDGFDLVDYTARAANLLVTIGDGAANDGLAGEGDDVSATVESVIGGAGNDSITGDTSAELLVGGGGDDNMRGMGGDDELRGEAGNDSLDGGPNDDLLSGGPGNDVELGGGYDDAFVQSDQTAYPSMDAPKAMSDTGTATSTLTLGGAPTSIQDLNVRLDIDHPATQHLAITLISPAGTRNLLSANRGNGSPFRGTVFDSEVPKNIRFAGTRPFEGRFYPEWTLDIFDGQNPNGTWTLEVVDGTAGSTGILNGWSLQLTFASAAADGTDTLKGISGVDVVDYSGRSQPVTVTMDGGADDGQVGESDNVGNEFDDIEKLRGGAGLDILTGTQAGGDEISGGPGADTISGLGGDDSLFGREGDDSLDGGDGTDALDGGPGADTVAGAGGDDSLFGRDGDDNLDGGPGTDSVDGGFGTDTCTNAETKANCELPPPPPPPPVTCAFDGGTGTVTVTMSADGDVATLWRSGEAIGLNGTVCGGATVLNTDLVRFVDTSVDGSTTVKIDQSGGPFAPGLTDEEGDSDEIEFSAELGSGSLDLLLIVGQAMGDRIVLGGDGGNLNAVEAVGVDADLSSTGVDAWALQGVGGNDLLSSAGGSGTGVPLSARTTLDGGPGGDSMSGGTGPDSLLGGDGFDVADYSLRLEDLNISIGGGAANDGAPGEGDAIAGTVEQVLGGAGNDILTGDESAELLIGGEGNDILNGGLGDDELRGGGGNDQLYGDGHDDFMIGGPGNDTENAGGFNDVFSQNPPMEYVSTDVDKPLADRGNTTSSLTISAAPTRIYDLNVRVDIEHPNTQHLTLTLMSPWGVRTPLAANHANGGPYRGTVFDSEAFRNIKLANSFPFEGRFHPDGTMEVFDANSANGIWTLEVNDNGNGSIGRLNGWSLEITYGTSISDGSDSLIGDIGDRDLVDYSGRFNNLTVTMLGGANDGQAGELDNVGADLADIEDVYAGLGNDSVSGTELGENELRGSSGNDQLVGLGANDLLRGQDGSDIVQGGTGDDTMLGNLGNDSINGGEGYDWLNFVGAPSAVTANLSTGVASGGEGADSLTSVENITGSRWDDTFTGNGIENVINAGLGNDTVSGLAADDRLDGGAGTDSLNGGTDFDTCLNGEALTSCEA